MKELNLKIKTCQDCPYAIMHDMDFVCEEKDDKFLCHIVTENLEDIGLPDWCPLEEAKDPGAKVGVAVFIINEDGQIAFGKRKNTGTGKGCWGLPGGRVDQWEDPVETAIREVKEETDLEVSHLTFLTFTNDLFKDDGEHWITLFYLARHWAGTLKNMEPEKCEEVKWCDSNNLPEPLFLPTREVWGKTKDVIRRYQNG